MYIFLNISIFIFMNIFLNIFLNISIYIFMNIFLNISIFIFMNISMKDSTWLQVGYCSWLLLLWLTSLYLITGLGGQDDTLRYFFP